MKCRIRAFACPLVVLLIAACRTYSPIPIEELSFRDRALSKTEGDLTVSVSVLTADEARDLYDVKLYKKKMQPVWIQIENRGDDRWLFLPRGVDPEYIPALEAAYRSHWTWHKKANRLMDSNFYEQQLRLEVHAGETVSGIVLAPRNKGARLVLVDLLADHQVERFEFVVEIPGFQADYLKAIRDYGESSELEIVADLDLAGLRQWVEAQPCCTSNAKGTNQGDPLNIVVIGDNDAVWPAFLRAGWDLTETMRAGSAVKTGVFGIFGGRYRYAPISPLYVFERPQDIALQKARHNIHLRNHLRLWLTPVTFEGKPVWLGQISRDIGSRMTTKSSTLTTHKIDPDVDETRGSLIQDFIYSQSISMLAVAGGVGMATPDEPRGNLTGDPYFTDGRRAVMVLTAEPTSVLDIEFHEWAQAPPGFGGDE